MTKKEEFYNWIYNNPALARIYEENNYKKNDFVSSTNKCLIFFSGNGLYFPNTADSFEDTIIKKDRYEWETIAQKVSNKMNVSRVIFVRDILKQWYVSGINSKINSIDKLIFFLKELTEGYRIITVGNSAGGYIATLVGTLLNAEIVLNFSGQFSLQDEVKSSPLLKKYAGCKTFSKYYDICKYIQNSTVPIMYFYPANSALDIKQAEMVKLFENVYLFAFDESIHGNSMLHCNIPYILTMSIDKLKQLSYFYKGKKILKLGFLFKTVGFLNVIKEVISTVIKSVVK